MAILGGTPISAVPISGLEAAVAVAADNAILPQMTAMNDGTALHGDAELEAYDSSDAQLGSPLHDIVAVADVEIKIFWGFFEPGTDSDVEDWTPDWAQAPPTDQFDETGQTRGQVSNNDWVDEDEPVTDGHFATPLSFPDDETGQTRGQVSNNDWVEEDEPLTDSTFASPVEETTADQDYAFPPQADVWDDDEPIADDWVQAPLEDAPVAADNSILDTSVLEVTDDDEVVTEGSYGSPLEDTAAVTVDDVGPQELGQVWDDDEPLADDWQQRGLSFPDDETGETTGQTSNNDWVEEDEPEVVGTFASPIEESQDDTDILGRSIEDLVDDDEPVTDGWAQSPAEETPDDHEYAFPPQAEVYDDDEPLSEGWLSAPLEDAPVALNSDITGTLLGEVFDDDEPLTEGSFSSPLENAPGLNDDITGTSFPDDTDLEGEEFHPDFFAGLLATPLEDTPPAPPVVEEDRGKSGKRVYENYDPYYYKKRNKRRTTKADIETFLAEAASAPVQALPVDLAAQHEAARVAAQEALTLALANSTKIALKEINAFYSLLREAIKLRKAKQEAEDDEDEDVLLLISAELF